MVKQPCERVEWRAPLPMWEALEGGPGPAAHRTPAILRFAGDAFMETFEKTMTRGTAQEKRALVAQFERYDTVWPVQTPSDSSLKLYQPAHGRFYLVCASLVCVRLGMPDCQVSPAHGDTVTFVLRRLGPRDAATAVDPTDPSTYRESAWIAGDATGTWQVLTDETTVAAGEERVALFGSSVPEPGREKPRRIYAALIPTVSRQTGAPGSGRVLPHDDTAVGYSDVYQRRTTLFHTRVAQVLIDLSKARVADGAKAKLTDAKAREVSFFALLDFAEYLRDEIPRVWSVVAGTAPSSSLSAGESSLHSLLTSSTFSTAPSPTPWARALVAVDERRGVIADPDERVSDFLQYNFLESSVAGGTPANLASFARGTLKSRVRGALPVSSASPDMADPSVFPAMAKLNPEGGDHFVIRCVYERPPCTKVRGLVVSEPTRPFRLAPFIDPDAPYRPVRIAMPVDTSIEGLRRHPKSVAIMVSDALRNQLERIRNVSMSDVEDGDLNAEGGFSLGMICSLSIPIITICALILLLIIVQLLNIVFWWLPFLKICFPVPVKSK